MKSCVIIGGGLGGLSCGVILAKNGYKVTVLEQGGQIGGCLQCFKREGVIFDTGMHYIGSASEGETLHKIFSYLEIADKIKLSQLDPLGYDVISYKGEHYKFANGRENFIETLADKFPNSKEELGNYYDLVKRVISSSAMHSLNSNVDVNVYAQYQTKSIDEVMDSLISDPTLREILVGIIPLYAGIKGHTPFSTHALIYESFNQSAYRIVGGSSIVADSLANVIRKYGGQVLSNKRVIEIECDNSKCTSVKTSDGESFDTELVISSIHPYSTVKLINSNLIRPAYRRRMEGLKNTVSPFTLYLKFKKDRVKYLNSNFYYYREDSVWGCEEYDSTNWPKMLLYMHFCHTENPLFAQSGEILTYMNFSEVQKWEGSRRGCRGDEYEAFKKEKGEQLIKALAEEFPGIESDIESYYTSTPLTYLDYTGTPEGSMYGVSKDAKNIGLGGVSSKTSIPNLLLTGQSITSHGMFGVLATSLVTCSELLSREKILNQIIFSK